MPALSVFNQPITTGDTTMQHIDTNQTTYTVVKTSTTAKQTARAMRVWLENKKALEFAGFHAGARYSTEYAYGIIVLRIDAEGTGTVSSCKRGDVVRPIIDLHSKAVAACFNPGEPLTVCYYVDGRIEIAVDMLALAMQ
jgi:hypothetical protein